MPLHSPAGRRRMLRTGGRSAKGMHAMLQVLELMRTVRFSVGGGPSPEPGEAADRNGFGGIPAMRGLGSHYEIDVVCRAEPDPRTGYAVDIHDIDRAVRTLGVPRLEHALRRPETEPAAIVADLARAVGEGIPAPVVRLVWRLSPTYDVAWESRLMNAALLRQEFEFAASHRLHVPELSDEENRRLFGKCNNPSGHGHNYRVRPEVEVRVVAGCPAFTLAQLERLTYEVLIRRFDHKNLNVDTPEFRSLNPSVEHIARVCFDLVAPAVAAASDGAALRSITVWETDKTSATYPA